MALTWIREAPELRGRRVTVMGLGLFGGGVGAARFLVRCGARVTVTDLKPEADLRESVEALRGWPVEFRLGGHREEDFLGADLVVVSPAVPGSSPFLRLAPALETEINLFFKLNRARTVVGVTGSNGKTTTTALIGEILRRGPARVWVGGNIGGSLLESVDQIGPDDVVVLELSSFQLERLGEIGRSPEVAVVLNLRPNHLDRHGTMEEYAAAKRRIVEHQGRGDVKVLNADDPVVAGWEGAAPSGTMYFGAGESRARGAFVRGERIELAGGTGTSILDVSGRKIPGRFNLENMAAAAAAVWAAAGGRWDGWLRACEDVFNSFPGVEHRLEFVAERGAVRYYNDSKATDPDATVAALGAVPGPIFLILGGFDKRTSFDGLARAIAEGPVRACALMGQTARAIEEALRAQVRIPEIYRVGSLEEALRIPARPGEAVLLSPACASWDMFRNFEERGRAFKGLVRALGGG